ncbi:hypothetical protein DPMN_161409 [Dreissena polymorpha]|uniref:Uncharacterized protein n=1 Tax=Dreissena polymorpha TaxID=45954 RepID=A0A9D4IPM8_DREPO|nr:hypothetical protein DPMN_161409 [Dreissena polymorpha]
MSSRYVGGFEDDDSLRLGPSKGSRNRSEFEARGSNRGNGTWVQLKDFHCPAERCPSREPLTWVCKKDEDFVFINEKGKIKCETGKHEADVCQWGWNCGRATHGQDGHPVGDRPPPGAGEAIQPMINQQTRVHTSVSYTKKG